MAGRDPAGADKVDPQGVNSGDESGCVVNDTRPCGFRGCDNYELVPYMTLVEDAEEMQSGQPQVVPILPRVITPEVAGHAGNLQDRIGRAVEEVPLLPIVNSPEDAGQASNSHGLFCRAFGTSITAALKRKKGDKLAVPEKENVDYEKSTTSRGNVPMTGASDAYEESFYFWCDPTSVNIDVESQLSPYWGDLFAMDSMDGADKKEIPRDDVPMDLTGMRDASETDAELPYVANSGRRNAAMSDTSLDGPKINVKPFSYILKKAEDGETMTLELSWEEPQMNCEPLSLKISNAGVTEVDTPSTLSEDNQMTGMPLGEYSENDHFSVDDVSRPSSPIDSISKTNTPWNDPDDSVESQVMVWKNDCIKIAKECGNVDEGIRSMSGAGGDTSLPDVVPPSNIRWAGVSNAVRTDANDPRTRNEGVVRTRLPKSALMPQPGAVAFWARPPVPKEIEYDVSFDIFEYNAFEHMHPQDIVLFSRDKILSLKKRKKKTVPYLFYLEILNSGGITHDVEEISTVFKKDCRTWLWKQTRRNNGDDDHRPQDPQDG